MRNNVLSLSYVCNVFVLLLGTASIKGTCAARRHAEQPSTNGHTWTTNGCFQTRSPKRASTTSRHTPATTAPYASFATCAWWRGSNTTSRGPSTSDTRPFASSSVVSSPRTSRLRSPPLLRLPFKLTDLRPLDRTRSFAPPSCPPSDTLLSLTLPVISLSMTPKTYSRYYNSLSIFIHFFN